MDVIIRRRLAENSLQSGFSGGNIIAAHISSLFSVPQSFSTKVSANGGSSAWKIVSITVCVSLRVTVELTIDDRAFKIDNRHQSSDLPALIADIYFATVTNKLAK
jgi:hypothetical protein